MEEPSLAAQRQPRGPGEWFRSNLKPTVSTACTWQVWTGTGAIISVIQVESGPAVAHWVGSHMKGAGLALKPIIMAHRVRRGLVAVDFVRWHQINVHILRDSPGEEYIAAHFQIEPSGSTHTSSHTVCSQIWGTQDLGEVCHRGSQDSRKQHNHLDSCSQRILFP